jgi:hypothetical protein
MHAGNSHAIAAVCLHTSLINKQRRTVALPIMHSCPHHASHSRQIASPTRFLDGHAAGTVLQTKKHTKLQISFFGLHSSTVQGLPTSNPVRDSPCLSSNGPLEASSANVHNSYNSLNYFTVTCDSHSGRCTARRKSLTRLLLVLNVFRFPWILSSFSSIETLEIGNSFFDIFNKARFGSIRKGLS